MQPSNLPPELLQKVLHKVDLPQRLRCCGLVCKAWHAAAVAATTSIDLVVMHKQSAAALGKWLLRHGSNVAQLSMRCVPPQWSVLLLPTSHLTQLEQLHCHYAVLLIHSGATSIRNSNGCVLPVTQQASLSHLTRLTSLQLECCTLRLHAGQALQALSSLSQLQRLALVRVEVPDDKQHSLLLGHRHSSGAHVADQLGHVLPRLVQLTHLTLKRSPAADTALQHISCLQGLKELTLDSSNLTTASFTALPLSLTLLEVKNARNVDLTSRTTPALAQLTALQHLDLQEIGELEPALLSGFVGLRHFFLCMVGELVPDWDAGTAALMAAVSQMTALQHLEDYDNFNITAAACTAFTASSQLTCLKLYDELAALPAGAGRFMFARERQLPSLQVLEVALQGTPSEAAAGAVQEEEQLSECQYSLNSIASSCPRLRELKFGCGKWQFEVPLQLECLQLLRGSLTRLELLNFIIDGACAATTLAALTGLQALTVTGYDYAVRFKYPDLLRLTCLQRLWSLEVSAVRSGDDDNAGTAAFSNQAKAGAPPDVWLQIQRCCMDNSPECVRLIQQQREVQAVQARSADTQEQLAAARAEVAVARAEVAAL